ncbi:PTS sugar transporter subunit IIA [Anaerococcus sp. AGMB00486]|uniref:PTS sugar transporter subunit IIA n=2 Tax=Anaerococcus TaxID=165779 RepID=A0ABX2N8Z4_9FIRM|nr:MULTISPECIES: PTS sugar transporter subunit IIA [Anaerococcus]MDY3005576.1 PTS sugar transporter subunit IIA [Anaerococcus porci]MSS77509.1 PTS sugar transporter subunit IIA [Anaerococcus porci]NVF11176.1 PTS sugar transporter subunit IIA [Anaerococcus faecalis]
MTNAVIAVSHASLASGIYSAIKMIAGDFDNVRIQEFKENDDLNLFDKKLKENYESLKEYDNVIVLADLAGGTPFNRAVMTLGEFDNVRVLAGLNFALLFQAINSEGNNIDECVDDILNIGRESIVSYKSEENNINTDDFEDGI